MSFVGDVGTVLQATITDQAGAVVDLTGATVVFRVRAPGGQVTEVAATSASPTTGVATATLGVLDRQGTWKWQPRVTWSAEQVLHGTWASFVADESI